MRQVDPVIYSGVDRAERRRLAKRLLEANQVRALAQEDVRHLRERAASTDSKEEQALTKALADQIEMSQKVPLRLLACATCHRPVPQCICTDADGNLLNWGCA